MLGKEKSYYCPIPNSCKMKTRPCLKKKKVTVVLRTVFRRPERAKVYITKKWILKH